MIHLKVDLTKCEGYANCVVAAPDLYDINDDGIVELLTTSISEDLRSRAEDAVRSCPAAAIWLE